MEVPPGQDGIQQLLAAEKEAQAIVAEARKGGCTPALYTGNGGPSGADLPRALLSPPLTLALLCPRLLQPRRSV